MNCKPGDLAVIVNAHPDAQLAIGRLIKLTEPVQYEGEMCWRYEDMPLRVQVGSTRFTWHEYPDAWLKPIRDPGDDAVDEVLQRIPSPFTTQPERTEA